MIAQGRRITGVTGDPAPIQSTRGDNGNFEMLVRQGNRVVHCMRDNDLPGTRWSRVADVMVGSNGVEPDQTS